MEKLKQKNALILCRVSSSKQAQEGESLDVQEAVCRRIAEGINHKVLQVFRESYSGAKEYRPVVEEIFSYIKNSKTKVDILIFRAIDRFTREGPFGYESLKERLADCGVEIIDSYGIIQPSINTLEHLGVEYGWSKTRPSETAEIMTAHRGKEERTSILTRTIGAEISLARQGFKIRKADDGYINTRVYVEGKKRMIQTPDPERAFYYIKMFELRSSGTLTDEEIVKQINVMGYRSRIQKRWSGDKQSIIGATGGLPLTLKQFQRVIRRPIYCGVNTEKWLLGPIKTQYKGLVSINLFNKANRGKVYIEENEDGSVKVHKDYNIHQLKRTKNNPLFPFKGVVLCPICSKPFLGSSPKNRVGKSFPTYHCCRNHKYYGVNKATLEKSVADFVSSLTYSDPAYFRTLEATLKNKFREKEKELGEFATKKGVNVLELEAEKKQAIEAFTASNSQVVRDELEKKIEDLHRRITEAQAQRNELEVKENDIHSFVAYVKKLMEHPEEYLVNQKDSTLMKSFYGLVFDEFPTYTQIINGTPKLSLFYKTSEEFKKDKTQMAGDEGIEPSLAVLETAVLPLN
jgi:site-specific DNA recombinase